MTDGAGLLEVLVGWARPLVLGAVAFWAGRAIGRRRISIQTEEKR